MSEAHSTTPSGSNSRTGSALSLGGLLATTWNGCESRSVAGALRLCQQLAKPSKDNAVYPWMFCGSISPLSVTSSPLFMEAFTTPQDRAEANGGWLPGVFNVTDIWAGR